MTNKLPITNQELQDSLVKEFDSLQDLIRAWDAALLAMAELQEHEVEPSQVPEATKPKVKRRKNTNGN